MEHSLFDYTPQERQASREWILSEEKKMSNILVKLSVWDDVLDAVKRKLYEQGEVKVYLKDMVKDQGFSRYPPPCYEDNIKRSITNSLGWSKRLTGIDFEVKKDVFVLAVKTKKSKENLKKYLELLDTRNELLDIFEKDSKKENAKKSREELTGGNIDKNVLSFFESFYLEKDEDGMFSLSNMGRNAYERYKK